MSLLDIKNYMAKVKISTLGSLCHLFHAEPDTVRYLMQHWIRKGKVRQCTKKPACGSSCFQCPSATTEIYEWVDEGMQPVLA